MARVAGCVRIEVMCGRSEWEREVTCHGDTIKDIVISQTEFIA